MVLNNKVICKRPGPDCSKLMMSLVNVSLNFQHNITNTPLFFVGKMHCKRFSHFTKKNNSVFDN